MLACAVSIGLPIITRKKKKKIQRACIFVVWNPHLFTHWLAINPRDFQDRMKGECEKKIKNKTHQIIRIIRTNGLYRADVLHHSNGREKTRFINGRPLKFNNVWKQCSNSGPLLKTEIYKRIMLTIYRKPITDWDEWSECVSPAKRAGKRKTYTYIIILYYIYKRNVRAQFLVSRFADATYIIWLHPKTVCCTVLL